ncbi:MAG: aminotransferase class I/II-fold pyridoxal phosphate-dependent enzyme [Vicingaceae bacterium]
MKSHYQNIEQKLSSRKSENAFRELKFNENLIDFCSNDYLGLASEKEIHVLDSVEQFGSTGSRLISGNYKQTIELENYLADFYKAESGLLFNSGYNANVGLFSCIAHRNDTIIYDELIHASIRDGIKLSNANSFSFKHNDVAALVEKIKKAKGNIYVAVESIYSMDGDEAPLVEMIELCKKFDAALIVDEAHATGVFGDKGEGLTVALGLENDVFARVVTFGKALGCHGAVVLGNKLLRDYLINYSRAFIYTTALPLTAVVTIKNAHLFLEKNLDRVHRLKELISYFKKSIINNQYSIINSHSAIQCIVISGNDEVKNLAEKVQSEGFDVRPILSPTVPKGEERLRICLHAFNTKVQIDGLFKAIEI